MRATSHYGLQTFFLTKQAQGSRHSKSKPLLRICKLC